VSWIRSAWERWARARSRAPLKSRTVIGLMVPSSSMTETDSAAGAGGGKGSSNTSSRAENARRARFIAASRPMIARDLTRDLFAQREDGEQLEQEIGGQQARGLAGSGVRRRPLDEVGADQVEARERAHERQRLERRQAADLGRARRRRVRRIDGVDVE